WSRPRPCGSPPPSRCNPSAPASAGPGLRWLWASPAPPARRPPAAARRRRTTRRCIVEACLLDSPIAARESTTEPPAGGRAMVGLFILVGLGCHLIPLVPPSHPVAALADTRFEYESKH